jgi:hypothetical protein
MFALIHTRNVLEQPRFAKYASFLATMRLVLTNRTTRARYSTDDGLELAG